MTIQEDLVAVKQSFDVELAQATSSKDLSALKTKYLGKKGCFRSFSECLKTSSPEERVSLGASINTCKAYIEQQLKENLDRFLIQEEEESLMKEFIDTSLPGESRPLGGKHILKNVLDEVVDFFVQQGFCVQEAPNIESEYNNFTLLNFSEDHPARLMQDTFYLDPKTVLRTHTSNVQSRVLTEHTPPIRVVAPGLCFRNEDVSTRSHVLFHQVEAFYVDRSVQLCHLTEILSAFYHAFFQREVELRFRHSYFPFVEPGLEVDVSCECQKGCPLCKHTGWLEVAGAGMIHPQVLRNGNIDPDVYSGYAFGMGIERLTMLKYKISDIRLFSENDLKFLRQFI